MALDHGFFAAVSVIIVSELGDKTFFIAAIMAMSHSRVTVFLAAISALITMTVLSVFLGLTTSVIPFVYTHYISIALFLIFGLKMLYEAKEMSGDEAKEELEEVQKTLNKRSEENQKPRGHPVAINSSSTPSSPSKVALLVPNGEQLVEDQKELLLNTQTEDPETGIIRSVVSVSFGTRVKRWLMRFISLAFLETLTMTFVAEWGDRSQITTIILAAREDALSVTLGAIFGHAICSMIAVIGGRMVAQMISVRTVTLIGGITFILFAIFALVMGED